MHQSESAPNKTVVAVVAHPDDEALGCIGTLCKHVKNGDSVYVIYMADGELSRNKEAHKKISGRYNAADECCKLIGVKDKYFVNLPDNKMDTIPLLDIVQKIEGIFKTLKPEIIYTHFGNDLNIDHRITYQAVMTACRPLEGSSVERILCFEVLSSTEWGSTSIGEAFTPNYFVDISNQWSLKLKSLDIYKEEMRDGENSRTINNVKNLSAFRGNSVGFQYAEAFVLEREILR
tara:strand:- start:638 stop:1336 length:699 start_codon:yes stop_codon:yes gene_type:complete